MGSGVDRKGSEKARFIKVLGFVFEDVGLERWPDQVKKGGKGAV